MKRQISRIALPLCLLSFIATSCGGHSAAIPTTAGHSFARKHVSSCTAPTNANPPLTSAGNGTTPSLTFTPTPAVGDLLVAGVEVANNSLSRFSDPGWTRIQTPGGPGAGELLVVEYRYMTTADSGTFTWTLGNSSPWAVAIQDLTCTATTSPIDTSSSSYFGSNTGGTTSTITGHVSDLPVALFGIWMGTETDTPRSPWTEQAFKTETPWASISLQNNLPLGTFLTATGGDTWSAAGPNSGAVLLVKPLSMPSIKHVNTTANTEQATTLTPTQICAWTTIAQDSNGGNEQALSNAHCIPQLYTDPTRQTVDGPNCKAYNNGGNCLDTQFAKNDMGFKLYNPKTPPNTVYLLAIGGRALGTCTSNNQQGATIATMETDYIQQVYTNSHSTAEAPFFDTPTAFNLTAEGPGSTFPCGYDPTNVDWFHQYKTMIDAVSIPGGMAGIVNGAACVDNSDCTSQGIDGSMYLLNSPNVAGILKEDCMNPFGVGSPPKFSAWVQTIATAIAVRTGGNNYVGMFPNNKFYVCRGTSVPMMQAHDLVAVRQWALATFWLTYDESTASIGGHTGLAHSFYSTAWQTPNHFTVLPEAGFVCTGPVKSDAQISDYTSLAIAGTTAYGREWNSCSLWTSTTNVQSSDGPCAVISVPDNSVVTWSSIVAGLQNGTRYTKSLVLTGDDAYDSGTATFTGSIPPSLQGPIGLTVCQG